MNVFRGVALTLMAGFFLWLLLEMSRTARSDRLLISLGLAFVGIVAAFGLGALLGRRGRG